MLYHKAAKLTVKHIGFNGYEMKGFKFKGKKKQRSNTPVLRPPDQLKINAAVSYFDIAAEFDICFLGRSLDCQS